MTTKKPSAAQLAARKKFAAMAKARSKAAKKPAKKKAKAKTTISKVTGKRVRTAATRKTRAAKNTKKGYYPNPSSRDIAVYAAKKKDGKKYWYIGGNFSSLITGRKFYQSGAHALNDLALLAAAKLLPTGYSVFTAPAVPK